jgi:hypothetical protein
MIPAAQLLGLCCKEAIVLECRRDGSIVATYPVDAETDSDRLQTLVQALREHAADPDCRVQVMDSDGYLGVALPPPQPCRTPKEIRVYRDGDAWCALVGDDLQSGIAEFGVSPEAAVRHLVEKHPEVLE